MKNTTQQPLKRKWTGLIDNYYWETPFGLNGLIIHQFQHLFWVLKRAY